MKRVLLILIPATIAEIIILIYLGIFIFQDRGLPNGGNYGDVHIWPIPLYILLCVSFLMCTIFKYIVNYINCQLRLKK